MTDRLCLIPITPEDYNPANFLYHAVWTHFHPGWLRPGDYVSECRCFRILDRDEPAREIFSFGLKEISAHDGWLEFAAVYDATLDSAPLTRLIRDTAGNLGIRRCYFLPTEKNPLVTDLIAGLNFRPIDRIVSLAKSTSNQDPSPPQRNKLLSISDIDLNDHALIDSLYQIDRTFPAIWRLPRFEFELALNGANQRWLVRHSETGKPIAYLLAAEEDISIHLSRIAVRPDFRDSGVGSRMVAALIKAHYPDKRLTVNTYRKNSAAIRMYEKLGFSFEPEFWTLYQAGISYINRSRLALPR